MVRKSIKVGSTTPIIKSTPGDNTTTNFVQFHKKYYQNIFSNFLTEIDRHAHILICIDDTAGTMEDNLDLIEGLSFLGYRHLIARPHVYKEY